MKTRLLLFFWIIITAILLYILSVPISPLPPLGSFFSPAEGFWANAETRSIDGTIELPGDKTDRPVDIYYDERGVPHIFAENDRDLYFAQGYVTARDRLFQLELQVRAAGGMLSEWLGETTLEYDLNQRRRGMLYGAEKMVEYLDGKKTMEVVEAYAAGINEYINGLRPDQYPVEYKIIDATPAEWKPLHSALLLKYMTQMLAGRNNDVTTSNTASYLGLNFIEKYITARSKWMEPIIPKEHVWQFDPLPVPDAPDYFQSKISSNVDPYPPNPANGSNNWAVSGSKTSTGYPILAGDPHLSLSLPSIWYEMQLQAPGVNVYGVSIPGAPGIIKGFNEAIAWSTTNTGADVMDWHEIEFRDDSRNHYLFDGEWRSVDKRLEEIRIKEKEAVVDTVIYTHHGPVSQVIGEDMLTDKKNGYALRWIAHDPSNEPMAFYLLNRAGGYNEASEALNHFEQPAQNFVYADTSGNIAMFVAGKLPLKWKGQGMTVSDGRDSDYDWQGWIPNEHNPGILNPQRGFVSSANQIAVDESYPYYLGDRFGPFYRGKRINDLLENEDRLTVKKMQQFQLDNHNYRAKILVPLLIDFLNVRGMTEFELELLQIVKDWDYNHTGPAIAPSIFYAWDRALYSLIWEDDFNDSIPLRMPTYELTLQMLIDNPEAEWVDDRSTAEKESLQDLTVKAFRNAIENLRDEFGEFGESWQWARYNNTNLDHLSRIPGLGEQNLFTDGSAESLNAVRGSHGPSWRMVVELGPEVKGYGVYPGGQTGNPGSGKYTEFIDTWLNGGLFELNFYRQKPETGELPLHIKFR
mgnify:CR=1 FL=1